MHFLESHQNYVDKLQYQYDKDRTELFENATKERNTFLGKAEEDRKYLQVIRYGQEAETTRHLKLSYENFINKYDDIISTVSRYRYV